MNLPRITLAFVLAAASAAAQANTIQISGTVRDFRAAGTPGGHPDFEGPCCGQPDGMVQSTLGPDGKPVLANGFGLVTSSATFDQWYRDVPGVNQSATVNFTLTQIGNTNQYEYSNNAYFPIDNQLFGNQGFGHNYHFTTEIHTQFTHQSGQFFTFSGDDDVWVFINGRLAIDIGGVHGAVTESVNLDNALVASTLDISLGETYSLDIFHAERHTVDSNFRITTSIALQDVPAPAPGSLALLAAGLPLLRRRA